MKMEKTVIIHDGKMTDVSTLYADFNTNDITLTGQMLPQHVIRAACILTVIHSSQSFCWRLRKGSAFVLERTLDVLRSTNNGSLKYLLVMNLVRDAFNL
jgi:hypothetical protein